MAYNGLALEGDSEPSMMAQQVSHRATNKKRVKVYELRNNDWFDRGTGFCTVVVTRVSSPTFRFNVLQSKYSKQTEDGRRDPRVIVESEDPPERLLLETKIHKEDGFQKQQGRSDPCHSTSVTDWFGRNSHRVAGTFERC